MTGFFKAWFAIFIKQNGSVAPIGLAVGYLIAMYYEGIAAFLLLLIGYIAIEGGRAFFRLAKALHEATKQGEARIPHGK